MGGKYQVYTNNELTKQIIKLISLIMYDYSFKQYNEDHNKYNEFSDGLFYISNMSLLNRSLKNRSKIYMSYNIFLKHGKPGSKGSFKQFNEICALAKNYKEDYTEKDIYESMASLSSSSKENYVIRKAILNASKMRLTTYSRRE